MSFNVKDFLSAWDWVQRRRLKTFVPSEGKQPKSLANLPCPKLESITYYPIGQVGEPFPVVISASNIGSRAYAGGITVSFPEISSNGQGGYVEFESSDGKMILRQEGDEIMSSDVSPGQKFTAKYLIRENEILPWKHNEEVSLKLKITPVKEGALRLYVTVWTATNDWQKVIRTPVIKDVIDQQGHAVYPLVVNVLSTK